MHEEGHLMGLLDLPTSEHPHVLMADHLPTGTRRFPTADLFKLAGSKDVTVPFFLQSRGPALNVGEPDALTANQPQAIGGLMASTNALAMAPVNLGTLPAGRQVTITFDARVNIPFPKDVTFVSNQGTVSGSNFAPVLTDDPKTPTMFGDPTITLIDNINNGDLPHTGETPWWRNWLLLIVGAVIAAIVSGGVLVRRRAAQSR